MDGSVGVGVTVTGWCYHQRVDGRQQPPDQQPGQRAGRSVSLVWTRSLLFITLTLLVSGSVVMVSSAPLLVGIPYTGTGIWSGIGHDTLIGAQIWADYVDSIGGIGPNNQRIQLVSVDVGSTTTPAALNATAVVVRDLIRGVYTAGVPIQYIISPYSSQLTEVAALVVEQEDALILTGGAAAESVFSCMAPLRAPCTQVNTRRFSRTVATLSPANIYLRPFVSLIKLYGATSMGIFSENAEFTSSMCIGAKNTALGNKISVISEQFVPQFSFSSANLEMEMNNMRTALLALKAANPDVIIGCVYQTTCITMVNMMKELDFSPKALALTTCVGDPATIAALGEDVRYIMGSSQWDARLKGEWFAESPANTLAMYPVNITDQSSSIDHSVTYSPSLWNTEFIRRAGHKPSYQAAGVMATYYFLHLGIVRSNSTATLDILRSIAGLYEPSYFGLLSQDRFGMNAQHELTTLQYFGDQLLQVVTPLGAADYQPVYPMPTWAERVYTPVMYATTIEKAVMALVGFIQCILLMFIVFFAYHRYGPVMKAASFPFVVLSIIGAAVGVLSVVVWPIENNEATCAARHWLLPFGFVGILAPLIAKTRRLSIIFNTQHLSATARNSSAERTLFFAILLVIPPLILCTLWHAAGPLKAEVVINDVIRPSKNITTCQSSTIGYSIMILLIIYISSLLIYTLYLAFRVRGVYVEFNETRQLATAIYIFTFTAVIILLLEFAEVVPNINSRFALRGFGLSLAFTAFAFIVFVPKVVAILMKENPSDALPKSMHSHHAGGGNKENSRLGTNNGDIQLTRITAPIDLSDGKATEKAVVERLGQINALFATLPTSPPAPPKMTGRAAAAAAAAAANAKDQPLGGLSVDDIYAPAPLPVLDDMAWNEVQQVKSMSYKLHLRLVANSKRVPPPAIQTSTKTDAPLLASTPAATSLMTSSQSVMMTIASDSESSSASSSLPSSLSSIASTAPSSSCSTADNTTVQVV